MSEPPSTDVNLRNLGRTESNVSLAPHDTNHIGGRRRSDSLATAIATRGTRAAPKTRPLSSLRDIGRFRPTYGPWTFELSSLRGSRNASRERLDEVSRVRLPESANPTVYGIDRCPGPATFRPTSSVAKLSTLGDDFPPDCLLAGIRQSPSSSPRAHTALKDK